MTSLGNILPLAAGKSDEEGLAIVTVIANRSSELLSPGDRMLIYEQSPSVGNIHPLLDPLLQEQAQLCLAEKRSRLRSYRIDAAGSHPTRLDAGDIDIFFEVLARPARLVIVGAGHIAVPLAQIATLLEFEVIVLDDRPDFASRDRFPDARQILVGPYRSTLATVAVDSDTHIVLVTRGHVHDQACLEEVLSSGAAYIGMIGSRRRVKTVIRHAAERGYDPRALEEVHAPIGLDIGAQTPAEIALAIMAEIVNVRRAGKASADERRPHSHAG